WQRADQSPATKRHLTAPNLWGPFMPARYTKLSSRPPEARYPRGTRTWIACILSCPRGMVRQANPSIPQGRAGCSGNLRGECRNRAGRRGGPATGPSAPFGGSSRVETLPRILLKTLNLIRLPCVPRVTYGAVSTLVRWPAVGWIAIRTRLVGIQSAPR